MDGLWATALVLFVLTEVIAVLAAACREAAASRLESRAREKGKRIPKRLVESLEPAARSAQVLTMILVCLAWVMFLPRFLDATKPWVFAATVLGAAALTVVLVDLVPSALAQMGPERIVFAFRWPLAMFCLLVSPVFALGGKLEQFSKHVAGVTKKESEERLDDEILEALSQGEREGYIESEERQMIEGVIEFHDIQVREVMTPRIDSVTIEMDATFEDAARLVLEKGHSRIPVFEDNRDNIVGILYEKDLLGQVVRKGAFQGAVADVMRKPYFIPETKSISLLLKEMRAKQLHIAIVLDEYGGTSGLVTIEDLLEEIVGEIEDEYDEANGLPLIRRVSGDALEIDAKYHIDDLSKVLGIELSEEGDFDTIGGLVSSEMGRIPSVGEQLEIDGIRLIIIDADDRKVKRLRVETLRDS